MTRPSGALYQYAREALGMSGNRLAAKLGVSRRTGQRWTARGGPSAMYLQRLAVLVYPADAALAAEIATASGTTLGALGVLPLHPPPAAPVPTAAPPDRVVDAVVCAAAESIHVAPQNVRPALLAAFSCARELGLTVEDIEKVLRAKANTATGT
jgi:transcriptional regulator with XRE-family HTH domain